MLNILKIPISIGVLAFLFINLLYIIPLPASIIKALSSSAYNLRETYMLDPSDWQTLSVYPRATVGYLVKIVLYIMVFLVVVSKCQSVKVSKYGKKHSDTRPEGPMTLAREAGDDTVTPRSSYNSYILLGALCAILSILFHSLSDFNLHIPANALYFTVMAAIVAGISGVVSKRQSVKASKYDKKHSDTRPEGPMTPARGAGDDTMTLTLGVNMAFLNLLINSVVTIAFTIALFGILQKLSYNGKIYWFVEKPGGHFGPYINYDHYAGFMEMCTMIAIASFVSRIANSSFFYLKKWKDKIVWFSTKEANKALIYLFVSIVMATSLFMSASRGGIMSFTATLAVFYFACVISAGKRRRKRILLATFLVLILAVIMILWVGPEETVDRFKVLGDMVRFFIKERAILSELRPHIWQDTLKLIRDYPVFGAGMGTYFTAFTQYRTFPGHYGLLTYAHNDYLHLIAEMGVFGVVFIVGFFVWYFRRFRECFRGLREKG